MEMKKIADENNLLRRTDPLTEEEANLLIERYKAKTTALLTWMILPYDPKETYLVECGFEKLLLSNSRGILINAMFDNHKKGVLPIIDPECELITDDHYSRGCNKFDRLMTSLSDETKKKLEVSIIHYYSFVSGLFKTNDKRHLCCQDFITRCTKYMDIADLVPILHDSEMDMLTKSRLYFSYISNKVFSDKQRPVRDSHYYGLTKISPEEEKLFADAINNDQDVKFLDKILQRAAENGQIESLEYLKEFFPKQVEQLVLTDVNRERKQMSPVLYHYSKGNYLVAKRLIPLCSDYQFTNVPVSIFLTLLENGMYDELLDVVSMDSFKLEIDTSLISLIELYIPKDELYMNKNTKGRETHVGITDEFTENLVHVLRSKPIIYEHEDIQYELDRLLSVTRRTGMFERERELKTGREGLAQTLGALHEVAADVIPWNHMIKEMKYGSKRGQ